jgi:hypothetical protein
MTTPRRPTHQEIAARAYQLFVERGRITGHEVDDWLQAEYELMQLPVRELAKLPPTTPAKEKGKRGKSIVDLVRAAMY